MLSNKLACKVWRFYCFMAITVVFCSCKKLVDIDAPITSINSANVYANDATAISAITGIYTQISSSNFIAGGVTSVSLYAGLSSDEFVLFNGITNSSLNYYYANSLTPTNLNTPDFWTVFYQTIYSINAAMEGLDKSGSLTPIVKQRLIGEAKFMRAFCYFNLVNLYGDVPLVLTTDYKVNAIIGKSGRSIVYQQIISDLKDAVNLLDVNYLDASLMPTVERVRPNKFSAAALLSRVYLYNKDYENAESMATLVIGTNNLYDTVSLNNVFLKNSKEAIWQLQPVKTGWNTDDAKVFVIPSTGPSSNNPVYLDTALINVFESQDQRKVNGNWVNVRMVNGVNYFYPYKYKISTQNSAVNSPSAITEYIMVLRLGELFLIRAEARALQNSIPKALDDLNIVRSRARLPNVSTNDKAEVINHIIHERRVELFSEWGQRWLDLKRTATVDSVMQITAIRKGTSWNSNWQFYPIPLSSIQQNPNLTQNSGY